MKKIVIIIAAILTLVGCTKETKTTYTVNVNIGYQEAAQSQGISYTANVMINEYGDGKKLTTRYINDINEGVDYSFEPNSNTEYLTVKYSAEVSGESVSFWVGKTYDIVRGENIDVDIVFTTIAVQNEPKR